VRFESEFKGAKVIPGACHCNNIIFLARITAWTVQTVQQITELQNW